MNDGIIVMVILYRRDNGLDDEKKEKSRPHRRDEDISDEKKREEPSS
ncbi:hypothetical protein [Sutcliffiella horikoshii]|nr:hypothetical protein [Sutcliffiella horikoshii]